MGWYGKERALLKHFWSTVESLLLLSKDRLYFPIVTRFHAINRTFPSRPRKNNVCCFPIGEVSLSFFFFFFFVFADFGGPMCNKYWNWGLLWWTQGQRRKLELDAVVLSSWSQLVNASSIRGNKAIQRNRPLIELLFSQLYYIRWLGSHGFFAAVSMNYDVLTKSFTGTFVHSFFLALSHKLVFWLLSFRKAILFNANKTWLFRILAPYVNVQMLLRSGVPVTTFSQCKHAKTTWTVCLAKWKIKTFYMDSKRRCLCGTYYSNSL